MNTHSRIHSLPSVISSVCALWQWVIPLILLLGPIYPVKLAHDWTPIEVIIRLCVLEQALTGSSLCSLQAHSPSRMLKLLLEYTVIVVIYYYQIVPMLIRCKTNRLAHTYKHSRMHESC